MKNIYNSKGTTLIELLVVMGIFGFVITAMFSQYVMLLQNATVTRKIAKTESDIVNVVWPLFKDIESSGFGIPNSGSCSTAISASGSTLTVHSTAAGDQKESGSWSYIGANCATTGLKDGVSIVAVDPISKNRIGFSSVSANAAASPCNTSWEGMLAYWVPSDGALECYETRFSLQNYTTSFPMPAMCAAGTQKVSRSVTYNAGSTNYQPMLDCVLDLQYRFGCINKTTGNLSWRKDVSCTSDEGTLKLVRIGVILQESSRTDPQASGSVKMFDDLVSSDTCSDNSCKSCDCSYSKTIDNELRYYKWRKIERTIALKNLE